MGSNSIFFFFFFFFERKKLPPQEQILSVESRPTWEANMNSQKLSSFVKIVEKNVEITHTAYKATTKFGSYKALNKLTEYSLVVSHAIRARPGL